MSVIYRYVKDHKPCESVFPSTEAAVKQAMQDMEKGNIYPQEITQVIMTRSDLKAASERRIAA